VLSPPSTVQRCNGRRRRAGGVPGQVRRGEAVRTEASTFTMAAYGEGSDSIHVAFRTASPSPAARRALGNGGDAFLVRRVVAGYRRDGDRSRSPVHCGGMHRPYDVDRAAWRTAGDRICNCSPNPQIPASSIWRPNRHGEGGVLSLLTTVQPLPRRGGCVVLSPPSTVQRCNGRRRRADGSTGARSRPPGGSCGRTTSPTASRRCGSSSGWTCR
jgi:hypothetical protein